MDIQKIKKRLKELDAIEQHIMFSCNFLSNEDKKNLTELEKERKKLEKILYAVNEEGCIV